MAGETKSEIKKQAIEGKKDLYYALFVCLAIVVFVRSFVYEPFKIPSSSMFPTLKIGDHIFVSKFSYGLNIPFTKVQFFKWSDPKPGDVIVFLFPREETLYYVKRVVGVPGDKVEIKGKDVFVNGQMLPKEEVEDREEWNRVVGKDDRTGELYRETVGERSHYAMYREAGVSDLLRGIDAEVVPPDHYFVMGDNRDDSYDSRRWGFVPRQNIKGKAQIIWLSLDRAAASGFGGVRWSRFFTLIR